MAIWLGSRLGPSLPRVTSRLRTCAFCKKGISGDFKPPLPPDPSLNPGGKGLKLPYIPYLQKSQDPSLPVTLGREEPDPNPGQIAKSNTCDVPNRRKTSTLSGYQKHFAVFDINKFSNSTSTFDADSYLRNVGKYPPSTFTQPVLKPHWNLYKAGY